MTRQQRLCADLRRLADLVAGLDVENLPRGRQAVQFLNELEIVKGDTDHDLSFLVEAICRSTR